MGEYIPRYEGTRWSIIYGSYEGVECFALNALQRMVQYFLPYVVEVHEATDDVLHRKDHMIILGTYDNNPWIRELAHAGLINLPSVLQGYTVTSIGSPWNQGNKLIVIAGYDPNGVLYGVNDLSSKVLAQKMCSEDISVLRKALDTIEDFAISEHPLIQNRGIWSWGYVIYNYKRFIDNMARLKMNILTVWNDCPPLNCRDLIDYAHSRGIKVILGFHWGWGIEGLDPASAEHRESLKADILQNYESNYRHLGADGIYFQTFTEQQTREIGGKSIAKWACEWVNDIASALLVANPGLNIQFGLHAMSILDNCDDLKELDPRVDIVWEDAGVIPYAYDPVPFYTDGMPEGFTAEGLGSLEATLEYSRHLVNLRKGCEFAMVAKGFTNLDWQTEFEHHGPFILGERSSTFISKRSTQMQPRWEKVNALWREHYPAALRFWREMLNCSPVRMSVSGLIEDGLFEERMQESVALFAEMLWNPSRSDEDILQQAEDDMLWLRNDNQNDDSRDELAYNHAGILMGKVEVDNA